MTKPVACNFNHNKTEVLFVILLIIENIYRILKMFNIHVITHHKHLDLNFSENGTWHVIEHIKA